MPDNRLLSQGTLSATTPTLRDRLLGLISQRLGDNRTSYALADKITSGLEMAVPPLGLATSAYDLGRAGAEALQTPTGQTLSAAGLTAATMLPFARPIARAARGAAREAPNLAMMGIKAYHGSPHSFDRFSTEHIGRGEGAQVFGHGLYFAENENVAKSYKNALGKGFRYQEQPVDPMSDTGQALNWLPPHMPGEDLSQLVADRIRMGGMDDRTMAALKAVDPTQLKRGGHMYEVDINAEPEHFLDYDAPISQQPPKISDAIADYAAANRMPMGDVTGGRALDAFRNYWQQGGMAQRHAAAAVAADLKAGGIPGIKYLDASSRGAGQGSRNYVVFDDRMVDILRKSGLAGLGFGAAATGGNRLLQAENQ
jgi:hypothetical protein